MSAASERLPRLLSLVPWLTAHDGITIRECAEHFGISEAELEADLWLVILCGVPGYLPDQLIDIDFWEDGRIHVIEPLALERPLTLGHEETLTLLIALRLLLQAPGVQDRAAIARAAAKLEQAMDASDSRDAVSVGGTVDRAVLAALDEGADGVVQIHYASGTDDSVSVRAIEPWQSVTVDGIGYIEAFCQLAQARRTFRLDRILAAEVLPEARQGPAADRESEPEVPGLEILLRLDPAARWIADLPGAVPRGPDTVALPAHSLAWPVHLVLGQAGQVQALAPETLRLAVLQAARAARAQYPSV